MRRLVPLRWLAGAGIGIAVFFASMPAQAHYVRHNYVMNHDCTRYKDPVTVVFQGRGAYAWRAEQTIRSHTGWRFNGPDSLFGIPFYQSVYSHGDCIKQHGEKASRPSPGLHRYHVRLFPLPHRADNGLLYVFATPHKENWVIGGGCGVGSHSVIPGHWDDEHPNRPWYEAGLSGFDQGRDKLINKLVSGRNPHHNIGFHQWRNTRSFKQCKGNHWAGSAGMVYSVSIG